MPKHTHLQSMEEQIDSKGHASAPFHHGKGLTQTNDSIDNHVVQLRAYKIHEEKGGSDLDNWLEAEQILRNPTNSLATADRTGSGGAA
jgi:hypothetical protein